MPRPGMEKDEKKDQEKVRKAARYQGPVRDKDIGLSHLQNHCCCGSPPLFRLSSTWFTVLRPWQLDRPSFPKRKCLIGWILLGNEEENTHTDCGNYDCD